MEEHWTSQRNKISINSLKLWEENPRLSEFKKTSTDKSIVRALLAAPSNSGLRALTNKIIDNGWQELESVVVLPVGVAGKKSTLKYLVLEGNRRISCLKLLDNPALAETPADKKFFERRSKDMGDAFPQRINVCVSPSEELAIRYVTSRHTQQPTMIWDAGDNHRWIHTLYEKYDRDVERVAQTMGIEQSKVRSALTSIYLRDYAINKALISEAQQETLQEDKFPWSTLDRTIAFSGFKQKLNLSLSEGVLKSNSNEAYFNAFLKETFSRIIAGYISPKGEGVITSRTCKNTIEADDFVKEIDEGIGDTPEGGTTSVYPVKDSAPNEETGGAPEPEAVTKPNRGKRSNGCLAWGYEINVNDDRINSLFNTLKKVSPAQHPDAIALALRSLMELSVKSYIKGHGKYAELKKFALKSKSEPTLSIGLNFLQSECSDIVDPNLIKSFNMLKTKGSLLSLNSLNLVAHSEYHSMSPEELKAFWKRICIKFFEELISMTPEK